MEELAPYRLGISNDYFYGKAFERAMKSGRLNVESVPSDEQNFRRLLRGRIDAFPMDRIAGTAMLRQCFPSEEAERLTTHPKPLYCDTMYLLLNRKNPRNRQLIKEFNAGRGKLRKSGQLDLYLAEAGRK